MPHTNKKQSKGKGVSSSGSSIGVRSLDYDARLLNNRTGALLSKRCMDLNNLIGSNIPQQMEAMGCVPDINKYYGTMTYRELDTEVPKLSIFSRYNEELVRELCMPYVPFTQITMTVFELVKLMYCIKHQEKLDVGKLIRQAIIHARTADDLALPFPAMITHFYEQVGLEAEQEDPVVQMNRLLNSRTFNDISSQRNEAGLQPVATRKRQRRDDAAITVERAAVVVAIEENQSAIPARDRRPDWVDELL
ncbi:hypothetical protein QYF36_001633 [Acer negundo]|nr:hypothetical protein QYF36_001633 [Acer negundo]